MQREHGRLAGSADENQRQGPCDHRTSHESQARHLREHAAVARSQQPEVERAGEERKQQNADQEKQVGEARDDKRLFRGGDRLGLRIVEPDQQVGRNAHQLPEDIHLENVRRHDQPEHRAAEQRQEGVIALEPPLALHVSHAVNVDHQRNGRDDDQHHHRDRVEQHAQIDMQLVGEAQPLEVQRNELLIDSVDLGRREVLPGRRIGKRRGDAHRQRAYESRRAGPEPLAQQAEHEERQHRQQHDKYSVFHIECLLFSIPYGSRRKPETASARRHLLILQFVEVFHFDVAQIAVNVDDDRYGDGRFGRGDRYGEQREEETFELSGKQIAVEHGEIDIHRIEDQLDRNEHGDQVTPRDESVHAGEKHHGGQNQVIFHSYFHGSTSVYVRLTALRRCRPAAGR